MILYECIMLRRGKFVGFSRFLSRVSVLVGIAIAIYFYPEWGWGSILAGFGGFAFLTFLAFILAKGQNISDVHVAPANNNATPNPHFLDSAAKVGENLGHQTLLGIDAFETGLTKADLASEQRELKFLLSYIMTSSSEMIIGDNIFSDTLNAYFDKALINSRDMVNYSDRWRTYNGVIARSKGEGSDINHSLAKSMCEIYLNDTSSTSTHQVTELISELSSAYSKVLLEFKPKADKELKRLS